MEGFIVGQRQLTPAEAESGCSLKGGRISQGRSHHLTGEAEKWFILLIEELDPALADLVTDYRFEGPQGQGAHHQVLHAFTELPNKFLACEVTVNSESP